jgi:hypothetical protein
MKLVADGSLRAFARTYQVRALDDAPFTPLPLADQALEDDEAELKARLSQLSYELPAAEWRAVVCQGEPLEPPRRFIDGSVFSRTVAALSVEGRRRPALLACVGALALELDDRRLVRPPGSLRLESVLCLLSNQMRPDDRRARTAGLEPPISDVQLTLRIELDTSSKGDEDITLESSSSRPMLAYNACYIGVLAGMDGAKGEAKA